MGVCSVAQAKHIIAYEDLVKVQRIADPQLSPDGKWVAYEAGVVDLAANKTVRHIWLVSSEGGEPRQLTRGDGSDTRPRWSPDGKSLAFVSTRGGSSQVWILSFRRRRSAAAYFPLDGSRRRHLGRARRYVALHLAGLSRLRG